MRCGVTAMDGSGTRKVGRVRSRQFVVSIGAVACAGCDDRLVGCQSAGEVPPEKVADGAIAPGRDVSGTAAERGPDEVGFPHHDATAVCDERCVEVVSEVPLHRSNDSGSLTKDVLKFVRFDIAGPEGHSTVVAGRVFEAGAGSSPSATGYCPPHLGDHSWFSDDREWDGRWDDGEAADLSGADRVGLDNSASRERDRRLDRIDRLGR